MRGRPNSPLVWRKVNGITERFCNNCQTWKRHIARIFTADNRSKTGLSTVCKKCKQAWYQKKPPSKARPAKPTFWPLPNSDRETLNELQRITDGWGLKGCINAAIGSKASDIA